MAYARSAIPPAFERVRDAVAASQRRVDAWLAGRWRAVLVVVAAIAQGLSAWRVLSLPGRPHLRDSRIFEYVGWQVARGTTLYVETFEVKPPLSFETTAALSLLAGDDQLLYHYLTVVATCVAAVCVVVLVGELAHDVTGEPAAAVAAGLSLYVLPLFALRSGFGFKAKYFVLATGLLAVWFAQRERDGLAGAAAAASVGYWQVALVFPVVVLAFATGRGRRAVGRVVLGGAVVSALVLAPVLLAGVDGVVAMLNQTVLVTAYAAEDGSVLDRAVRVPNMLWWGRGLFAVGALGLGLAATRDRDSAWWAAVCGAWFLAVAVAFDLDAAPDLFPSLAFLGVGIALVAARVGPAGRGVVLAAVAAVVVLNVGFLGGFGVVAEPMTLSTESPPVADPDDVDAPYSTAEHHALLWHGIPADTCHVFFGPTQEAWVDAVEGSPTEERCRTTFP
ncbi:DolP-mannose mannosyltransferase [Halorubellus sp. JP-L1]|uniref:DolP-mannose mannosyltransferase n=1 Tax=Halorubellus sp. JP-L1 TaxID=2715753 RepID=UPI00140CBE01|nr:DolP-mannose mannosyltransferase [Halorubellus sp. JP-L1]NHN41897.1 DolP-mannose mannosyltransferase [Halorubellus sp. JP-L1]